MASNDLSVESNAWIQRIYPPPNVIIKFPPPKPHWDTDRPTFTCIRFYIDDN